MTYQFSDAELNELKIYAPMPVYVLKGMQIDYSKSHDEKKPRFPFFEIYPRDSNSLETVQKRASILEEALLLKVDFNDLFVPNAKKVGLN